MQVTSKEWQDVMTYVQKKLLDQIGNGDSISRITVIGVLQDITAEQYSADTNVVRGKRKPVQIDSKFREIWDVYPASASFSYRGISWKSSRVLRANYQVCEMLYLKAVAVGSVTHDQILGAVKKQIQMVKEESYQSGNNGMQYLSSLEVYLRQEKYGAFLGADVEEEDEYDHQSNCA